jgi:hypothetical protein
VIKVTGAFGIITRDLSHMKNVPQKMQCYSENGDELSGGNARVNCILMHSIHCHFRYNTAFFRNIFPIT